MGKYEDSLKKKKFQGTLWEYDNTKVNVTQRSPWNSIYVSFLT
jgi:hypothetical protein